MRRRRRRFCCRWRRALRLALGGWRRLRPRGGLSRFRLRTSSFWSSGFGTIRLRCGWTIVRGAGSVGRLCLRTSVLWRGRWAIRLCRRRTVTRRRWLRWTIIFRTIFLRRRGWAIRLRCGWTVRFRRSGRALNWSWSRLSGRTVRRLVGGRLSWAASIRLTGLIRWMSHGRCRRFAWRRDFHHRMGSGSSGWTQALHLARGDGLSGMRCQRLLLFGKRHGRRRRRFLRDHGTVHYCCRRRGHVAGCCSLRSKDCLLCGSHRYPRTDRRAGQLLRVDRNCRVSQGLCAREGMLRNHHHRSLHASVRVGNVGDGRALINDGRVVDVRHLS